MAADDHRPWRGLILGGARSGKSRRAETLARALSAARGGGAPIYIATAEAHDAEMAARIAEHQARRGPDWRTIEAPRDLAAALTRADAPNAVTLVDCLTLWLSNILLADENVSARTDALLAVVADAAGAVVLVSNEVGLGIVPDNALARRFRDAQGRLNQQVAAVVDHVAFCAAGLAMPLKGAPPAGLEL